MSTEAQEWTDSQKDVVEKLNEALQKVIDGSYSKIAAWNAEHAKTALTEKNLVFACYHTQHTVYGLLMPDDDSFSETTKEFVKELTAIRKTFEKEFDVEYPDTA